MKTVIATLIVLGLSAFIWTGCNEAQKDIAGPDQTSPKIFLAEVQIASTDFTTANSWIQKAMEIQERHTDDLLDMDDIIGTAIGRDQQGRIQINVFTEKDLSGHLNLPEELQGLPVVYENIGSIYSMVGSPDQVTDAPQGNQLTVGAGSKISASNNCRSYGTLGMNYGGQILSNNHVIAAANHGIPGDTVYYGRRCRGPRIGTLADFVLINFAGGSNSTDWATASIEPGVTVTNNTVCGFTIRSGSASAYVGMPVQKCGGTTGITSGQLTELNGTVWVDYDPINGKALFKGVTFFSNMSRPGDSGSVIIEKASGSHVALLFAGSPTRTIAVPF